MAKKKVTKKKKTTPKPAKKIDPKVEKILVENFVSLQKVMTDLSIKFEGLTKQISKLLELFEESAKAFIRKDVSGEKVVKQDREVLDKIDSLFEQNKILARGMTLIHEQTTKQAHAPRIPSLRPPIPQRLPIPERKQEKPILPPTSRRPRVQEQGKPTFNLKEPPFSLKKNEQ